MSTDINFIPYPDVDDKDFYDNIFAKKEFNKTAYSSSYRTKKTEELCTKGEFKMQNHQEFIRNFISPESPYNGALLFHGTGVGKTCTSIGAAEGMRDYIKNSGGKIYILSSENIRPNFYKELYNFKKEKVEKDYNSITGSYQCASDRYYPAGVSGVEREAAAKAIINQYYSFYGFGAFANFVDIQLGAKLPSYIAEPKITNEDGSLIDIGEYFGNSIIIIDEAHGIAGDTKHSKVQDDGEPEGESIEEYEYEDGVEDGKEVKKRSITTRSLFQVLLKTIIPACREKGNQLKLILLTATPMKDNIHELADLLQLLNTNDGRLEPDNDQWRKDYFPRTEAKLTKVMEDGIKKLSRGYVSYVKGNNPITFPIPLLPPAETLYEPGRVTKNKPYGDLIEGQIRPMYPYRARDEDRTVDISKHYDIFLDNGEQYKFDLVHCPMSVYHFKCYLNQLRSKTDDKGSSDTQTRMISNMVFPHKDADKFISSSSAKIPIKEVFGNTGFDATFKKTQMADRHIAFAINENAISSAKKLGGDGNFLKQGPGGLEIYSQKFNQFVTFINSGNKGVVYAYSDFVKSGALMGALVLEANGFIRYTVNLKKHLEASGLPKNDIQTKYPPSHLLILDGKHQRDPKNFYRCALCSKVYNDCIKIADHQFKIATYILITGGSGDLSFGNISDIEEATTDNIDGSKIRVVMGTQTTGQGVDFKWVRQVHILDPWHNYTRIYQAIGRGLRHCSHADLPVSERNVTIYRYSSTAPDIGEATDILTETVDEHIYLRATKKDFIIKQIERVLKESAVDCELNRMRNYFPSDLDYSRECDYAECKYTCDGFLKKVEYIRKIKKIQAGDDYKWAIIDDDDISYDEDIINNSKIMELVPIKERSKILTSLNLWDAIRPRFTVTIGSDGSEEMLVDIPLIKVDDSTYNIYFSEPQVNRAIKIITSLYQTMMALTLQKIIYLCKISDSSLEDNFIFIALNKLVGNLPNVKPLSFTDRYGRNGNLTFHNGYYVYQPSEIKDTTMPLFYRSRPLSIKMRNYNMDQLVVKPKAQLYVTDVADATTDKIKDILAGLPNVKNPLDILTIYKAFNQLIMSEHRYIIEMTIQAVYSNSITTTRLHILEYYLRSGLLVFDKWAFERSSLPYNTASIADLCERQTFDPLHFITSDGGARIYAKKSDNTRHWIPKSIDDVKLKSLAEFTYPVAPRFDGMRLNVKTVFVPLSESIYCFYSSAKIARVEREIIEADKMPAYLSKTVSQIVKNYPNESEMQAIKLKIYVPAETVATTKGGTQNKRNKNSGIVCGTMPKDAVKKNAESLYTKLHAAGIDHSLIKYDLEKATVESLCDSLSRLLFISDYYNDSEEKRYYLTPIETETYLPTQVKGSKLK